MTIYSGRFHACLAEVLRWEGGWSDHPRDTGGPTMRGVTIYRYADHMGYARPSRGTQAWERIKAELRRIPDATLHDIYHRWYWQAMRGDDLPVGLDLEVFDFAVNAGHPVAIRHLQRVLGVRVDSDIGPATLGAARKGDPADLVRRYTDSRCAFYRACREFPTFGKGWLRRADGVQTAALQMIAASSTLPPDPLEPLSIWEQIILPPIPDADAQAATQGRASAGDPLTAGQTVIGRASGLAGGLGSAQMGVEVASAASRARAPGGGIDPLTFLLTLAQSPTFWVVAGIVASAAYVWFERKRQSRIL